MISKNNQNEQADIASSLHTLRRLAEEVSRRKEGKSPGNLEEMPPEEVRKIFHEISVHQIELEMQNAELRQAQAELIAERLRYQNLFDFAPVGYVTVNKLGVISEANLAAANLFGVPRTALIKQLFTRFILPEDQDINYHYQKQLFSNHSPDQEHSPLQTSPVPAGHAGESNNCELRMVKGDGTVFWGNLAATAAHDKDDLIVFRIVLNDISALKQAGQSLQESEARYALLTKVAAEDGLWDWHVPSGKAFFSSVYYRMLGYEEGEFPAYFESMRHLIHPDDIDIAEQSFRQSLESGKGFNIDLRMRKKTGEFQWVSTHGKVVEKDEKERALRMVGTLTDITERKRVEQELQNKNIELERFSYAVSHDLKSPLITIQAYAGMIAKDLDAGKYERARQDIKRIEGAADRMTALLNDLLALSRAGRVMGEPSPVDMNRVVKDTLGQLTGLFKQHQAEVVVQPDLPFVPGDQKRIAEVVQNLLENAIKYRGDQPALRIEIGTRQDGTECVFFVRDNGKGLDPRHHEKVFGLFNKLDEESEGTGVGLALVKRIIEVHGGRVWVESEGEGEGSCFCFTVGL